MCLHFQILQHASRPIYLLPKQGSLPIEYFLKNISLQADAQLGKLVEIDRSCLIVFHLNLCPACACQIVTQINVSNSSSPYLEERLRGPLGVLGGHDEDRHGAFSPCPLPRHCRQPSRPLQLDLVEGLARRKADVVHTLRKGDWSQFW